MATSEIDKLRRENESLISGLTRCEFDRAILQEQLGNLHGRLDVSEQCKDRLEEERDGLRAQLHEICEIYAGMEAVAPPYTFRKSYLVRVIAQMNHAAQDETQ